MSECPFHELQTVLVRSAPSVFGCCVCDPVLPPPPETADGASPAPQLLAPLASAAATPQQQQQQQTLRGKLLVADNPALPSAKPAVVVLEADAALPLAGAGTDADAAARYTFRVSSRSPGPCLGWTQRKLVLPCRGRIAALAASITAPVAVVLVNACVPDGSRASSPASATVFASVSPAVSASAPDEGTKDDHAPSSQAPKPTPQMQEEEDAEGLFPDAAGARSCLVVVPLQRDAARERRGADGCVVQPVPLERCRVLELSFAALGMARQGDADVFVVTGADGSLHLFARSEQQQGHLGEVAVRALLPELAPVQACARSSPVLCVNVERVGSWRVAACGCANGLLYLAATNLDARPSASASSSSSNNSSNRSASNGSTNSSESNNSSDSSSNSENNESNHTSTNGSRENITADCRATLFLDGPVTSISYCPTDKGRSPLLASSADRAFPLPASLCATAHAVRAAAASAAASSTSEDPPLYAPQPVVAGTTTAPTEVPPTATATTREEDVEKNEVPVINMVVGGAQGHVTVFTDVARCGLAGAVPLELPPAPHDDTAIVSSVVGYRHVDQRSGVASCNVLVAHGRNLLLFRGPGPRELRLVWRRAHEAPILRVALADVTGDFVPEMIVLTLTACHVLQQTLLFDRLAAAVKEQLRQLVHIRHLEDTLARLENDSNTTDDGGS